MLSLQAATPMATGMKLLNSDCPSTPKAVKEMSTIPYQSAIGAVMYMASTQSTKEALSSTWLQLSPQKKHCGGDLILES
jgi:hypothetical protein